MGTKTCVIVCARAQETCGNRGGRPGLPVPNSPYGLCGRKATLKCSISELRICMKVEVDIPVPNCSYGLCGRKATLNLKRWTPNKALKNK